MSEKGEKHFTASALIITKDDPKKMLLINHKKFNKWVQPGGHIEKFENPIEAIVREVFEETGIDISFLLKQTEFVDTEGKFLAVPRFYMEQTIPPHEEEPEHFHLDHMYVVEVDEQELKPGEHESSEIGWFTKEEIANLPIHKDSELIIAELM